MGDARVFWSNVFEVLDHQGRSLTYLARRLGVSGALVYRWRDGSRVASAEQRLAAAHIVGVPESILFLRRESPVGDNPAPPGATTDEEPSEAA